MNKQIVTRFITARSGITETGAEPPKWYRRLLARSGKTQEIPDSYGLTADELSGSQVAVELLRPLNQPTEAEIRAARGLGPADREYTIPDAYGLTD